MNASFRSLRRVFAAGALATLTISAGGCFTVEQVADETKTGEPAAGGAASGDPDLTIAMGDEAAGPMDLNVDATLGEVSAADVTRSFAASDKVPNAPPSLSPSQIPSEPSFTQQTPAPALSAEPPSEFSASGGDFATAPVTAGEFSTAPALGETNVPASPALGEAFALPADPTEFQPAASPAEGSVKPIVDPASEAAVAPMADPQSSAKNAPAASEEFSPAPAPSVAAGGLQPAFDPAGTPESAPSASLLTEPAPAIADPESGEPIEAEIVASPDLAAQPPAPPLTEAPSESSDALTAELTPPAAATPESESLAGVPSLRDSIGAVPIEEVEPSETAEPAGTPFEEEDFAPRFGPGRHFAGSTPAVEAPESLATPGAALLSGDEEEGLSDVLAQESPSPAADALAMQIYDPSAPPPASLRPTAGPNANLPAFDPTIGERFNPPTADLEDYTPTPDGETGPPATLPGPAVTSPEPREIPMPGPARDGAADDSVPTPPATTPSGVREPESKRASTTAEIAEASRDWTDASGSHTLKAAILEYDKGEVRLETPKGERYVVSLSSLSRYDQGYVKGLAEGTLGKPPVERTWSDGSGEFSLVGEFVEDAGAAVRIRREDGKTFRIEKDKLADYDRGYVDGLGDAK